MHRILAARRTSNFNEHDKAAYHQERALSLNPNSDLIVVQQGEMLTWLGRPEEGIEWIRKAMRLNPYHPERFWNHLGRACFAARRYAEAIDAFRRITRPTTRITPSWRRSSPAAAMWTWPPAMSRETLDRAPDFTVDVYLATQHYKEAADRLHHRESLLAAGFAA